MKDTYDQCPKPTINAEFCEVMSTGVRVDESTNKDDTHQIQETAGRMSDNERRTMPRDNKKGARKTTCSTNPLAR